MRNKYRIVRDCYSGYETQVLYWWWPFWWFQLAGCGRGHGTNTSRSVEEARQVARRHKYGLYKIPPARAEVVEYTDGE